MMIESLWLFFPTCVGFMATFAILMVANVCSELRKPFWVRLGLWLFAGSVAFISGADMNRVQLVDGQSEATLLVIQKLVMRLGIAVTSVYLYRRLRQDLDRQQHGGFGAEAKGTTMQAESSSSLLLQYR